MMKYRGPFFKYTIGVLLILTIIFLLGRLQFFFAPFQRVTMALFFPIVLSGFFYYLFRPLIRWAENLRIRRFHISRNLAIAAVFLFLAGIFAWLTGYAGVQIHKEFKQLLADLPGMLDSQRGKIDALIDPNSISAFLTGKLGQQLTGFLQKSLPFLTRQITGTFSAFSEMATVLVLVPFILFYFLRDDSKFAAKLICRVPTPYRKHVYRMMAKIDQTLAAYITGRVLMGLAMGILFYIGYRVAGVRYPVILAVLAIFASFIPIFGTFITVIPAVIIGFAQDIWIVVKILGGVMVINILKSRLIAPYLIGKPLKIHPLTIIILFLAAGSLFGFIGLLIAVPVYAVAKIILNSAYKLYRSRKISEYRRW